MQDVRRGRHRVSQLHAHLIFTTKYRGKLFEGRHLETLEMLCRGVCEQFEVQLKEFNGESDHCHLLVEYPPTVQLTKLINSLKGVTSRKLKLYHPELTKPAYLKNALWTPSYFVGSCGGASIEVLEQYIKNQNRPQ